MISRSQFRRLSILLFLLTASTGVAAYKARPWNIRASDSYPARLTSEKVTIAVEPLYLDALAAQVFDKNDIVTRGIMPVAIVIFNDNDFPVEVEGASIQLLRNDDRLRTLIPQEVVHRLFSKDGKKAWIPNPIPKLPTVGVKLNDPAMEDFDRKFFGRKVVMPREKAGGFLFFKLPEKEDPRAYLKAAKIYIPKIARNDTGAELIFFEIDLQQAVSAAPRS
jgi:hypothetical protein